MSFGPGSEVLRGREACLDAPACGIGNAGRKMSWHICTVQINIYQSVIET